MGDRAGEGVTLNNIGLVYDDQGRYEEALAYYQQALAIAREVGDRAEEGTTLHNIGGVYHAQGRYEEALAYHQQALAIAREVGDRAGEGTTLTSIGLVYHAQGRYEEALGYYQQALAIRREVGDRAGEGVTLNNIGGVYDNQGRYEEALEYYQQALAIAREVGDRAEEGRSLNNIGGVYHAQGRYEEALEYLQQALAIRREVGDRAGEETTLHNIGMVYDDQGRYEEALEYLQQALEIEREVGDRDGEGRTLTGIGGVYYAQGQYEEALGYFQQALAIFREVGDRAGEGTTLHNIGMVYDAQGQYEEALDCYEQAMSTFEAIRATAGSEQARAAFIAQHIDLYHRAAALYHQLGRDDQAFLTTERGRARAFLDSLATGYVQLSDNEAAALLEREREAYAARQAALEALVKARAQSPDDVALIADLEAQLQQAKEEYTAVVAEIEARSDRLASLIPGRSSVLDLPQVQALLDDRTVLLDYWVMGNRTLAFIVTHDTLQTVELDTGREELRTLVDGFRAFPNLDVAYPGEAVTLYNALIAPLREHLTLPYLLIVPHDILHYLPFAALSDGERYLMDDYLIAYLPSASALPFIRENLDHTGGSPLILGNPTTADYDATASLATERDALGPLPFAEQETRAIAALYGVEAYVEEAATESLVREQAPESGILHIAAHGLYNPHAPLASLIALSPDEANDGWLTVGEIYGLDLWSADLVVLSACDTQVGVLSAGDELVGMTRAFFYAGTPTVVASLWSVDDQATAELMQRFHEHLQEGLGKAEALRLAQQEIRAEHPNPYYWAAFVLSGDEGETVEVSLPGDRDETIGIPKQVVGTCALCPCVCLCGVLPLLVGGAVGAMAWTARRKRGKH